MVDQEDYVERVASGPVDLERSASDTINGNIVHKLIRKIIDLVDVRVSDGVNTAAVKNTTPLSSDYGIVVRTVGGGGGGGPATIADGDDVAEGATTDAAVITDTTGTVSGKLRGLVKFFYERMPTALTGSGNLKVAVQEAIPAGTNNIGDVDVLTLPSNARDARIRDSTDASYIEPPIKAQLPSALSASGNFKVVPNEEVASVGVGAAADAEASGNGSVIAVLKRLRTLLNGGLPAALVGGRLDVNQGAWLGSTAPTVGQKTMANSVPVAIASDQGAVSTIAKRPLNKTLVGNYYATSGILAIAASAHAATAGFFWLVNTSSTVKARVKRITFTWWPTSTTARVAGTRITVERATSTGTPSGAQITPAKRLSGDSANTATLRTASTGLTLTAGAVVISFVAPPVLTGVGTIPSGEEVWEPRSDDESLLELGQNEELVFRQADAGVTSDDRKCSIEIEWEEY